MSAASRKQLIEKLWQAAIDAVVGDRAVKNAFLADGEFAADRILAVGKAAVGMARGALDVLGPVPTLLVTKYDHSDEDIRSRPEVRIIEAAHPVPDAQSLLAGQAALDFVASVPSDEKLLLLVSGGASSLAEVLAPDTELSDLKALTDALLAEGKPIAEINAARKARSLIKGGQLAQAFSGEQLRGYAISDVEGDSLNTIGSGLAACHDAGPNAQARVIASNQVAREALATALGDEGSLPLLHNSEALYDDVNLVAQQVYDSIADRPGVYVFGGEPTVVLPDNPGQGGRNQALALNLAIKIKAKDNISILVAGTDGSDGPTQAAGGLVDGQTVDRVEAAQAALDAADSGSYLAQRGALFVTGPTHTNVMDLVIAVVE